VFVCVSGCHQKKRSKFTRVRNSIDLMEAERGATLSSDGWWKSSHLDEPWHYYSEKVGLHIDYNHDRVADWKEGKDDALGVSSFPSIYMSGAWVPVRQAKGDPRNGCEDYDGKRYEFRDGAWIMTNANGSDQWF
jgi:hypothetical protein